MLDGVFQAVVQFKIIGSVKAVAIFGQLDARARDLDIGRICLGAGKHQQQLAGEQSEQT